MTETENRIVRVKGLGGPEVLRIDQELPSPPADDEVSIRVRAIGLNRADVMFRRGTYLQKPVFPSRLGFEAAGEVIATGGSVQRFRPGDRVSVIPGAPLAAHGTCADWVNIPASHVIPSSKGLDDQRAAALLMSYLTPYGALVEIRRLARGQWIVITAANSTVGLAAIDIARAIGARPIATVLGEALREPMLHAGAEAVIVIDREDLGERLQEIAPEGIHAAFDAVGGPHVETLAQALRPHGTIVIHGALSPEPTPFPLKTALRKSLSLRGYLYTEVTEAPDVLARAREFLERGIAAGAISPRIDRTYDLNDIVEAHRYLETGTQFGKIVVTT